MSFLHSSTHSDHDPHDEKRSAVYIPDSLASKLLSVCDAAAGLESSEPNSPIQSDLEDLWSNILASSVSSVDSFKVEEDIQRLAERYGLAQCLSGQNLRSWLSEVENLETPTEDLYRDILEAAFGNTSGGTAFKNGDYNTFQLDDLFNNVSHSCSDAHPRGFRAVFIMDLGLTDLLQFDEQAGAPVESPAEITLLPPSEVNTHQEQPSFYHNRPHTPQVVRVDLSNKNYHDFWEVPNLMKKPNLFPPTLRNIKNWIYWRRVHGRRHSV